MMVGETVHVSNTVFQYTKIYQRILYYILNTADVRSHFGEGHTSLI